jgi:undecaprenyl-diphosphatase
MNETLFLYINSFAGNNHILDLFFIISAKAMPYIFIGIEVWLYFVAKRKTEAIFAFYSVVLAIIISKTIGVFYYHNRPFVDGLGATLISHKADSSFPSDHTTFLFAIAFSYLFFKLKKLAVISLILAFLGGIARVYVGVHYPFDIMGGIFVGFVASFVVFLLREKLEFVNEIIFKIEKKILKNE